MSHPIWKPTPDAIERSQMMAFLKFINQTHHLHLQNYAELYAWSIQHSTFFWAAIWNFNQVIASNPWDEILLCSDQMPGAKWFVGSKLNFAENLLRYRDSKPALIFYNEQGERRIYSYEQLHAETQQLAAAMRAVGITPHDTVVGFMPNMPETIIAMLATTSIGAIWSSCSPDFGTQGVFDRFNQIQPKMLFATDGYNYNGKIFSCLEKITQLQAQIPSLQKTIIIPYLQKPHIFSHVNTILYPDFLVHNPPKLTFTQLPFDHPIYILYSSGTTGAPKCIVHGAGGVLLQHLKELKLHSGLSRDDTFFYFTTCGWMMWNWMVSGLAVGSTLILYDGSPFYPKHSILFDLIEKEKINLFGISAKYLTAAEKAKLEPTKTHDVSSLRCILSTGSPLLPMNYDYVYQKIKQDLQLSSISGGTDIISCFALGNPILPVFSGELQSRGLGLKVEIYDEQGHSVICQKGELVCTAPFPTMPICFWNDPEGKKYHQAYFTRYPNVWTHGDYAEITEHDGVIIYGRSDTLLKPGGIRIGTAEIYRQVEQIEEVAESVVIGQEWNNDIRVVLFVKLQAGSILTSDLKERIKSAIRSNASPHHVPAKIIQVPDIPKTLSGKIVELAIRDVVHNKGVKNQDALANPEALEFFRNLEELAN